MMWKRKKFLSEYKKKGFSFFSGKFDVYPVSRLTSLIIKNKEDLLLADMIMRFINKTKIKNNVLYDNIIKNLRN